MTITKICFVIPSLQAGGMERVMSELLKEFNHDPKLKLHLIVYGKTRLVSYPIPEQVKVYFPDFRFQDIYRFWHTVKTLLFIRRTINHIKPLSILSFGEYWNSFVLMALLGLRYPVFISDRCKPDKKYGRIHSFLRHWLYPKSYGIVAQTQIAKDIYFKNFRHPNIEVIGNPIRQIVPKSEIEKENIILSVGRLISSKHHDELIRLFAAINPPGWKLIIVGGNSSKQKNYERLQLLISEMGLDDKVILTGEVSNVDDYYLKSKIFAFTSSSEGFPNVIGEAMSAELPVVSYDCVAGPSEMIEDGKTGFLVPLFDSENFKVKLSELINNETLRKEMGNAGKESIDKFNTKEVGKKFKLFILNGTSNS